MTDLYAFGERLGACRRMARLSQQELAERSDLSIRAISNLERGRVRWPHPDTVHRLADALGLHDQPRAQFIAAAARRLGIPADAPLTTAPDSRLPQAGSGLVAPRQLPPAVPQFVGRRAELAALTGLLGPASGTPAAVVISAIGGMAGVGKTALAVRWAHQVASRFPDGQLYVDLRGFHPLGKPMSPTAAIRCLLDALQVPAERVPASLDARVGLYRSLLSGRRMLVMLDNARDAGQVRPLLPGSPGCLALITSRSQLGGLVAAEGAHQLTLDLLTEDEAHELLARRLGAALLAAEPAAAAELIGLCARLPLALAVAAARISVRSRLGLSAFAEELNDARRRLDALDAGDAAASVRAVFSWSLSSLSTPAAPLFGLLGLHPGPDITIPAAASLAGIPPSQARRALDKLAEANLIFEHAPGRFGLHDLLRTYAVERATTYNAKDQRAAIHRMLDYYLHTSYSANRVLYPGRDPLILSRPQAGAVPDVLAGTQQAQAWLQAERRVLLAVIAQATELSFDTHAWQIPYCVAAFLDLQGYWDEWAATQRAALTSAQRLGDTAAQARVHAISSHACMRLGAGQDAETHLRSALRLYRQLDDRVGQAHIHVAFSLMLNLQGRHGEAFGHAQHAVILFWAAGIRAGLARALNAMGWSEAQLVGNSPRRVVACCQLALGLNREIGNKIGEAESWDSLGYAYHQLGDHGQATACYERAISCLGELASRHEEAVTRTRLGDAHLASGDPERARDAWERALAVFDEEDHPSAGPVRRRLQHLGNASGVGASETKTATTMSLFEPVC
jgi:tetratricopeptide (TPR) repeat protein/transcriptional regulator with XRE-family HTH domain